MSQRLPATLSPGDGIGPEIVDAALALLEALGAPFDWDHQVAGLAGVQAAGDPLPQAALDSIRRTVYTEDTTVWLMEILKDWKSEMWLISSNVEGQY